ncbi:MAG: hypothetical protein AB7D34_01220 [Sulfurimonas sp.]
MEATFIEILRDIRGTTFDENGVPTNGKWLDIKDWHAAVLVAQAIVAADKLGVSTDKDIVVAAAAVVAADKAVVAADKAVVAADKAVVAADKANVASLELSVTQKHAQIIGLGAAAVSLSSGTPASASYNATTGILTIGVPQGLKGDRGEAFNVSAQGLAADRVDYDLQPAGFSYFAEDAGLIYFKNSATSGDWGTGISFGKGDTGPQGESINMKIGAGNTIQWQYPSEGTTWHNLIGLDAIYANKFLAINGKAADSSLLNGKAVLNSYTSEETGTPASAAAVKAAYDLAAKAVKVFATKAGVTSITVDGTTLDMTTFLTPTAGLDYYFSKTAITATIQADTIGGFHYSLVPHAEAATGNKTEADMVKLRGINAYSIWTLWDRPVCPDARGKVKVGSRWYDIYLMDRDYGIRGYSAPTVHTSANIAGGVEDATYFRQIPKIPLAYGGDGTVTYGKYTWFQSCEVATATGNQNISYNEFPTIAYGVVEGVDSSAYGDNGTIFHIPQLMSKYGIEMATGTEWVWGTDLANGYGTTTFAWLNNADSRGRIYATSNAPVAVILGGYRATGVNAGSRASNWSGYVWHSFWHLGSRFACDSLEHA